MKFNFYRSSVAALMLAATMFSNAASAEPIVTYSWTTTSQGFGPHLAQPGSATFDVGLSAVQSGKISLTDIANIQFTYPGLAFDNTAVSILGSDFAAFVDPVTGALVYASAQQGLALVAYAGNSINNATTFLSITFGLADNGAIKDSYNALNNASAWAGFPTAGYWTAKLPVATDDPGRVPEPASVALLGLGMCGLVAARRRRQ
jgi:hypothetical protein